MRFSAFEKVCTKTRARRVETLLFLQNGNQCTFNDLNSDVNSVNNDRLNSFVVNFDTFYMSFLLPEMLTDRQTEAIKH